MSCEYMQEDGAGHYCKLCTIPTELKKDYPHKYWRVFCYGLKDGLECQSVLKKDTERNKP